MPQHFQSALDLAVDLRKQCEYHHMILGSNNSTHAFILEVLEQIQKTYGFESRARMEAENAATPAYIPAPTEDYTAGSFTQQPPTPPSPCTHSAFTGNLLPVPAYTGFYTTTPAHHGFHSGAISCGITNHGDCQSLPPAQKLALGLRTKVISYASAAAPDMRQLLVTH